MSIVRTAVNRPITVVIICALVLIVSSVTLTMMSKDLTPDITIPVINVITTYEGASPSEVESSVTKILEEFLINVSDIDKITSTSSEEISIVSLEFKWDVDLDVAKNDIRDQLSQVEGFLPDEVDAPSINEFDLQSDIPILGFAIFGGGKSADELYDYADNTIKPYIQQVGGVSSASLDGGREKQLRVELIQNRLEAYHITSSQVVRSLLDQNLQLAGGKVDSGNQQMAVRADGKFKSPQEAAIVSVADRSIRSGTDTTPVRLRDIGDVFVGYNDADKYVYLDGKPTLFMQIYKQSSANTVAVAESVIKEIEQTVNPILASGITITRIFDNSIPITNSINQVFGSIITGSLLTILTLLFFLRSVKSSLIVAITLPLSIMATIMMMYFFGLSLNVISLAGLNLGVGMMVDSSIVLLENTTRYREKGVMAKSAAILGSQEMVNSILGGTLTTVCVFLPIVAFNTELEIVGMLMRDMAFTIVISLLSSFVFALITVPVLAGVLLPVQTTTQRPLKGVMKKIDGFMARLLDNLDTRYAVAIDWALKNPKKNVLIVFASLFISFAILKVGVGFEMFTPSEDPMLSIDYKMAPGTHLDVNRDLIEHTAAELKRVGGDAITHIVTQPGKDGFNGINSSYGSVIVTAPDAYEDRPLKILQMQALIRQVFSKVPGMTFEFARKGPTSGGADVEFAISTNDLDILQSTADQISNLFKTIPNFSEVISNMDASLPEIKVNINRSEAARLGITYSNIAHEVSTNVNGFYSGRYEDFGDDIDVWTVLREQDRKSILDLPRIFVLGNNGQAYSLANIASLETGYSFTKILRETQRRQIVLNVYTSLVNGKRIAQTDANKTAMDAVLQNISLPEGVVLEEQGSFKDFQELAPKIGMVFMLAILLVYGVMASQFENLKDPFIIIASIITIPIGPTLIYFLGGDPMSVYTFIGFIILSGIVVNNGIVLVDYTNTLRKRGIALYEAVIQAGRSRLRPILMTTLTTVLGMIPMAISQGDGTAMTQPIGITVLSGMIFSSVLTLLFTPVLYYLFNKRNEAKRLVFVAQQRKVLQAELDSIRLNDGEAE